jgi:hypothetical protein
LPAEEPPLAIDRGEPEPLVEPGAELDPGTGRIVFPADDDNLAEKIAEQLGVVRIREAGQTQASDRLAEHAAAHALDIDDQDWVAASRRVDRSGIDGLPAELRHVAGGEGPDGRQESLRVADPLRLRSGAQSSAGGLRRSSTALLRKGSRCSPKVGRPSAA